MYLWFYSWILAGIAKPLHPRVRGLLQQPLMFLYSQPDLSWFLGCGHTDGVTHYKTDLASKSPAGFRICRFKYTDSVTHLHSRAPPKLNFLPLCLDQWLGPMLYPQSLPKIDYTGQRESFSLQTWLPYHSEYWYLMPLNFSLDITTSVFHPMKLLVSFQV